MTLYGLLSFCAVYLLVVATPGPGVAAVIARSLGHGMRGAPAFIAGFLVGDLIWFAGAAAGLAALAQTAQRAFLLLRYAGCLYLLYLAWRMWTAPPRPLEVAAAPASPALPAAQSDARLFLGSLTLTLGNPKPMVFFVALLPTVVRLDALTLSGYLLIALGIAVILPLVLVCYALAATRARRLFSEPRSIRLLNRGAGVAMAGAAVVVAVR